MADSLILWTIYSPQGSSVHGILQATILEWAAIPSSRGSSGPRDGTHVSYIYCTGRQVLYHQHHLGSPGTCYFHKMCCLLWCILSSVLSQAERPFWCSWYLHFLTQQNKNACFVVEKHDNTSKTWNAWKLQIPRFQRQNTSFLKCITKIRNVNYGEAKKSKWKP